MTEPSDPRCLKAAKRIAEFYQREHGVAVDDFDVQRIASAIEADTGIRALEIRLMNARTDLARIVSDLGDEPVSAPKTKG